MSETLTPPSDASRSDTATSRPRLGPRLYLSYGMTKTGSTLAFHVTRAMLKQAGYPQPRLSTKALPGESSNNFLRPKEALPRRIRAEVEDIGHPIVVKLHAPPMRPLAKMLEDGFAIGHLCYRDPRDQALSLRDAGDRARQRKKDGAFAGIDGFEDAVRGVKRQQRKFYRWLTHVEMMPLFYEDFAFDNDAGIRALAHQLGIECDTEAVLEEATGQRTGKNRAVSNRYLEDLPAEDARRLGETFAEMIEDTISGRVLRLPGQEAAYDGWRRGLAEKAEAMREARRASREGAAGDDDGPEDGEET